MKRKGREGRKTERTQDGYLQICKAGKSGVWYFLVFSFPAPLVSPKKGGGSILGSPPPHVQRERETDTHPSHKPSNHARDISLLCSYVPWATVFSSVEMCLVAAALHTCPAVRVVGKTASIRIEMGRLPGRRKEHWAGESKPRV